MTFDIGTMSSEEQERLREEGGLWCISSSPNYKQFQKAQKLLHLGENFMDINRYVDARRLLDSALNLLRSEPFDRLDPHDTEHYIVEYLIQKTSFTLVDCLVIHHQLDDAYKEAKRCETVLRLHPIGAVFKCSHLRNTSDDFDEQNEAIKECIHLVCRHQNLEAQGVMAPMIRAIHHDFVREHKESFLSSYNRDCNSPTPFSTPAPTNEEVAAADAIAKDFDAELAEECGASSAAAPSKSKSKSKKSKLSGAQKRSAKAKRLSEQKEAKKLPPVSTCVADTSHDEVWYKELLSSACSMDCFTDNESLSIVSASGPQGLCLSSAESAAGSVGDCYSEDDESCAGVITVGSLESNLKERVEERSSFDLHAALARGVEQQRAVGPFAKFNRWRRMQKSRQWSEWSESDTE